jgi:hypothetical protein
VAALAVAASVVGAGSAAASTSPTALARAEARLAARFAAREIGYPPARVTLVAFKREARLELWSDAGSGWRFVRSYLMRAASGRLGPKLRAGDHQVPEGVYAIAALNPDSHYHLALRLDYPNAFDRARGDADGRTRLGGDIMIHGGEVSDGCLPVGDAEIEELFALATRIGTENVAVVVSPLDLRRMDPATACGRAATRPFWLPALYAEIATALAPFPPAADDLPVIAPRRLKVARPRCRARDEKDCVRRCDAGDMASCARAGLIYAQRARPAGDVTRAWGLLEKACTAGDALGCAELGQLYVRDDGPRRDAARAAALAAAACDAGEGNGCAYLAKLCGDGLLYPDAATGARCSADEIRRLRERAVAMLDKDCVGWGAHDCDTLATIYGPGDPETALRFAAGSCRGGDPAGCGRLASDASTASVP